MDGLIQYVAGLTLGFAYLDARQRGVRSGFYLFLLLSLLGSDLFFAGVHVAVHGWGGR